ncbi:hypothetical protein RUND412_002643 [Rhizina undulata]
MVASKDHSASEDSISLESTATLPTTYPVAVSSPQASVHPAFYVTIWIALSSSDEPLTRLSLTALIAIFLTTWHLIFATIATQVLAKTTNLLDGRKTVKMTGRVYLRAILPIGVFFSMSLICGNQAYLYLSVAFIQMLKATTPVAVLLVGWGMNIETPSLKVLSNVSFIVIGVILASYGEIAFNMTGFVFQVTGIMFEAIRLVLVQRLLSSAEYKMDPLVSLYYFAPICAVMNFFMYLIFEATKLGFSDLAHVGLFTLLLNAVIAFGLNVSVVFLIGKTSSLVLTLCGVLKDILLVAASVIIWGSTVTGLQIFGYAIALGGLVYYKLGADKLREHYIKLRKDGTLAWQEYGKRHPAWRKATIAGGVMIIFMIAVGGMYPRYPSDDMDVIVGNSHQAARAVPPPF